ERPGAAATRRPAHRPADLHAGAAACAAARRSAVSQKSGAVHVLPPLVVRSSTPLLPATQPCVRSTKQTAIMPFVVPVLRRFQCPPPSAVLRTRPPAPTT